MKSAYRPWKAFERRHAKRMGGERLWRPDYGDSAPDGESPSETWDCKVRKGFHVIQLFLDAERKYKEFAGARGFHLALYSRAHPKAGDFVLVRAERYAHLVRCEEAQK